MKNKKSVKHMGTLDNPSTEYIREHIAMCDSDSKATEDVPVLSRQSEMNGKSRSR